MEHRFNLTLRQAELISDLLQGCMDSGKGNGDFERENPGSTECFFNENLMGLTQEEKEACSRFIRQFFLKWGKGKQKMNEERIINVKMPISYSHAIVFLLDQLLNNKHDYNEEFLKKIRTTFQENIDKYYGVTGI